MNDTPTRIISASRRTDIPALYGDWFIQRLRAGYCTVANPFRPSQLTTVGLRPEDVAGFVFWTRSTRPFRPALDMLDERAVPYYLLFSLLGYPRSIEPRTPTVRHAVADMRELAQRIGSARVSWRYDPVILTDSLDVAWHLANFTRLADALADAVDDVIVSVVDPYRKTRRGMQHDTATTRYDPAAYVDLLTALADIAADAGLRVRSCTEPDLHIPGIRPGACVDADRLTRIAGHPLPAVPHHLRDGCRCHRSIDIGANNTCTFGCRYCYATRNHDRARACHRHHDPAAERC